MNTRTKIWTLLAGSVLMVGTAVGGCANAINSFLPPVEFAFPLDAVLGVFVVGPDVSAQKRGTGAVDLDDRIRLTGGRIELNPSAITVIPSTDEAKVLAAAQNNLTLEVVVRVGPAEDVDTVCDSGERYPETGSFVVTLDDNFFPIEVSPSSVVLRDVAEAALASGSFSICITIDASFSASVRIDNLDFELDVVLR